MDEVDDARAWLCFYLDAFGAVGRAQPGSPKACCRVGFIDAREDVIDDVRRRLVAIGVEATVRRSGDRRNARYYFRVEVGSRAAVLRLVDAAMPTVPGKRAAAEALVRRLRDPGRRWPPGAGELRHAYWDEGLGMRGVGARFGYTASGICRLMQKHGIPRRTQSGGQRPID